MADLSAVDKVRVVEIAEQGTVPADAAIGVGVPVYHDGTSGKAKAGSAAAAGTAGVVGVNISPNCNQANMPANFVKRGIVVLFDSSGANILAGLSYGASVYLSNTTGRLADAAGTVSVVVGKVVPIFDQTTPTKALWVEL